SALRAAQRGQSQAESVADGSAEFRYFTDVDVAYDRLEALVVQRQWAQQHGLTRKDHQPDPVAAPLSLAQEVTNRALPRVESIALQVLLLHRLGEVEHEHDADALHDPLLLAVGLRACE